jgi:hypothetical protein
MPFSNFDDVGMRNKEKNVGDLGQSISESRKK